MGFATTKEAADPDRLLLRLGQAMEIGRENTLQASSIFAIADKGFQLEAERLDLALVMAKFGDFRDAVTRDV